MALSPTSLVREASAPRPEVSVGRPFAAVFGALLGSRENGRCHTSECSYDSGFCGRSRRGPADVGDTNHRAHPLFSHEHHPLTLAPTNRWPTNPLTTRFTHAREPTPGQHSMTRSYGLIGEQRNGRETVALGAVGGIVIRGLGPCFYLSPFGMRLRGVSI